MVKGLWVLWTLLAQQRPLAFVLVLGFHVPAGNDRTEAMRVGSETEGMDDQVVGVTTHHVDIDHCEKVE